MTDLTLETDFKKNLKRINFIYQNDPIITKCIKNFEGFSLLGHMIGPFKKGKRYKLKYFIAEPFIKQNILEVIPEEKCDNMDVQRLAIRERDDQRMVDHKNKYLLNKVREFRKYLVKRVNENKVPQTNLNRYNSYLSNLVDSRLLKLLKLSRSELSPADEKNLTNAEKILNKKIFELINTWRKYFLDL
ncbi:MAG: hypothetical protein ACOC35_11710 [Promethearchaeia archaeon]